MDLTAMQRRTLSWAGDAAALEERVWWNGIGGRKSPVALAVDRVRSPFPIVSRPRQAWHSAGKRYRLCWPMWAIAVAVRV